MALRSTPEWSKSRIKKKHNSHSTVEISLSCSLFLSFWSLQEQPLEKFNSAPKFPTESPKLNSPPLQWFPNSFQRAQYISRTEFLLSCFLPVLLAFLWANPGARSSARCKDTHSTSLNPVLSISTPSIGAKLLKERCTLALSLHPPSSVTSRWRARVAYPHPYIASQSNLEDSLCVCLFVFAGERERERVIDKLALLMQASCTEMNNSLAFISQTLW